MKLFRYEGYKVVISEEALLLEPFKKLWVRDRSKGKVKALQELGFIYFMMDPRSDYQYITNEKERAKAIIADEGLTDWKPDSMVEEAMKFYASFKTSSALLLEDTKVAIDKLRAFLREVDLTLTDDKGKPVYAVNTITSTIKQIPTLVKELDEAERAISKEIKESGKMRGQAEKSLMEDSLDIL